MDVCDPDAKTKNIRKLIKLHTGKTIKISRDRICDIMKDVDRGNLPLPPLVLTRDKRYLLDPKSPLTRKDFENLFKSNVTSKVVKRLAKKVGLIETDKTISELKRAIGRKLASMNVREPILLPGSRVYSKIKSEEFENEGTPIQTNENENENENENRNREENRNQGREENRNRGREENRNRNRGREENRNRDVNINSSGRSLRNTLARKRHIDRIKQMTGSGISSVLNGSNRRNMNSKLQMEKIKLDANRRIQEQKRNFNRRFSEKQVIEERRKRREARIIETKVQNGRRAQINADNRARKAEAARNREYENKKRAELKANTNSQRVRRLEKNYENLRNKTRRTLNRYNLNRKRAFTQLSESQTKMRTLGNKLRKELDRANLERSLGAKIRADLDVAKLKIEKSEQRIKEIEKERTTLNTTISNLQSRLDMKTKNGNEDEVDRLSKELEEAKTKIEKLTKEVTTLTNNTKQVVADATKELNEKLAQAVIASNANKKKAALSEAKYKAARSEMNSKNQALALRERDSKSRKRDKLNALLTNIGVTNKTSLMNEYNAGIKNGKNPNDMINSIVKKARLSNKEAARASASIAATSIAKASMQNELNKIKNEKEKALEKAANERRNAVAAVEKATREKALAETATEKAAAEQKLKNAQSKINMAVANKEKALQNAKTERNAALNKAMSNKKKAIKGLRANRNAKLRNKNVEVASARMVATATAKASMQSELNTIRKEKENALALANAEKKKAVALAEEASKAKAAANTLAEKTAAEKKAAEARRLQEEVAAKMKAASNKAAANKAAANKAAANKAAANKAAANKAAKAKEMIETALRAKAQQARIVEQKKKNEKLVSNRQLVQDKMAMVAKMRKILATYKGTDPIRKASITTKGDDLMRKIQKGELKMVDVEKKAAEIVRDMKTKNRENATKKLVIDQRTKAEEQFVTRKKNLAKRLTAAAAKDKVDVAERKRVDNAKRRAITARIRHANKQKVTNPVNIKLVRNNPLFNMKLKRNVQFENALAQKGKMRTNPLALNTERKKNVAIPIRPSYKDILQKQNPGAGLIRPARMAGSSERIMQRRRVENMNTGPKRVQAARLLASNRSRNALRERERMRAIKRGGGSFF